MDLPIPIQTTNCMQLKFVQHDVVALQKARFISRWVFLSQFMSCACLLYFRSNARCTMVRTLWLASQRHASSNLGLPMNVYKYQDQHVCMLVRISDGLVGRTAAQFAGGLEVQSTSAFDISNATPAGGSPSAIELLYQSPITITIISGGAVLL